MSHVPRALVVSGIWPPDVGGPASHGPDLGGFLVERGFAVRAVVTGDVPAEPRGLQVHTLPRLVPLWQRMVQGEARLLRETRQADIVYATGLYTRATLGAAPWSAPVVLKLTSDPAFERAVSLGLFHGSLGEFGRNHADPRITALIRVRDKTLARAVRIITPSDYLARRVATWSIGGTPVTVVPNAAPTVVREASRSALRQRLGVDGPTIVFAGRLVRAKNLPLAVRALREVDRDVSLVIIGEGPAESDVRAAVAEEGFGTERVRLLPATSREDAVRWMQAADVTVLSSDYENHPHAAVESLAVGTPVVATAVGGLPEIVRDDDDGALVPAGDSVALGRALARVLAQRAREGRVEVRSGRALGPPRDEVYGQIEEILRQYLRAAS